MKKLLSLVLALAMMMMVGAALADPSTPSITINPANPATVENVAINYSAYRILEADIGNDPVVAEDGSTTTNGQVAYYVTTADRVAQLTATNLFNISQVGNTNKWYVELKGTTTADQLVTAFSASSFDLSKFDKVDFDKTASETNAASGNIAPGYYYITSSLGSKIALQTLTAVTINEKNSYTTDDKSIPEADKNSEIGKVITYTLTVNVPASANKEIVLKDTMSRGLTYKGVQTQKVGEDDFLGTVAYNATPAADGSTSFTITYTAAQITNLVANGAKTIVVTVNAMVNDEAAIETDIPNTLDLTYGNEYDAIPDTVNTKTYKVTFDKEDNNGNQLPGAEFKLTKNTTNDKDSTSEWIPLIEVAAGQTYRIATADEITAAGNNLVEKIVTNGNTVTINGLDLDDTYFLVETKAPTGYNILENHVELTKDATAFIHKDIQNNKGTELPSTGGIGTTIFYAVGGLMVLGAAIIMVSRRKAEAR